METFRSISLGASGIIMLEEPPDNRALDRFPRTRGTSIGIGSFLQVGLSRLEARWAFGKSVHLLPLNSQVRCVALIRAMGILIRFLIHQILFNSLFI
jgi:hypothetical protein